MTTGTWSPLTRATSLRVAVLTATLCVGAVSAWAQADIQTGEFFSESVGRTTKYNIALPRGYDTSDRRYPVLYLLHALSQNYQAWGRQGVGFYAPLTASGSLEADQVLVSAYDGGIHGTEAHAW